MEEQIKGPWAYRQLETLSRPVEPSFDSYQKFETSVKLPKSLDLSSVKVLWSKEKETAEQENRRREEIARKLREQKQKLANLVKHAQSTMAKGPSKEPLD